MYSVEYYKTKKEMPKIAKPLYLSDSKRMNNAMRRIYFKKLDMIEKCLNVKSLTIDLKDINRISKDRSLFDLRSLIVKAGLAHIDDSVNAITILNNNKINQSYIYSIINCEWMVDKDDVFDDIDYLETVKKIYELIDQYNKETDRKRRARISDEIELTKYFMAEHARRDNETECDVNAIKLGKRFIKKRGTR